MWKFFIYSNYSKWHGAPLSFSLVCLILAFVIPDASPIKCYKCKLDYNAYRRCGNGEIASLVECSEAEKFCYFRQSYGDVEKGCAYSTDTKTVCHSQGEREKDVLCICDKSGCNNRYCTCDEAGNPVYNNNSTVIEESFEESSSNTYTGLSNSAVIRVKIQGKWNLLLGFLMTFCILNSITIQNIWEL